MRGDGPHWVSVSLCLCCHEEKRRDEGLTSFLRFRSTVPIYYHSLLPLITIATLSYTSLLSSTSYTLHTSSPLSQCPHTPTAVLTSSTQALVPPTRKTSSAGTMRSSSPIREMVLQPSLSPLTSTDHFCRTVLSHIISQLRPGADLSRVVLPTFILEPRSMLERITKYVVRTSPDISLMRQLHGAPRNPPSHVYHRRPCRALRLRHPLLPQRMAHQTAVCFTYLV